MYPWIVHHSQRQALSRSLYVHTIFQTQIFICRYDLQIHSFQFGQMKATDLIKIQIAAEIQRNGKMEKFSI